MTVSIHKALIVGLIFTPVMMGANTGRCQTSTTLNLVKFAAQPDDRPLRCEVTPVKPALDFSFRFQTGFSINVPMEQYFGPGHAWTFVARVSPEHGAPAYLAARISVCPTFPITTVKTDTSGGFLVGAGRYKVDWVMYDDEGRVCRHQWKIEAKLSHGERHVEPAIPANTVTDVLQKPASPHSPPAPGDAPPFRLTVLLHAAPFSPRRLHLRSYEPDSSPLDAIGFVAAGAGDAGTARHLQLRYNRM